MNLAIVGLDISHPYSFAPLFQKMGLVIKYVTDSKPVRAAEYAQRFGCAVIPSLEQMPWPDIHGALITTIASEHAAAALPFLERGIPTFVDKQLAATLEDAQRIVATARR